MTRKQLRKLGFGHSTSCEAYYTAAVNQGQSVTFLASSTGWAKRSAPLETEKAPQVTKAAVVPRSDERVGPDWEPATFVVPGFDQCFTRKQLHKLGLGHKTKCEMTAYSTPGFVIESTEWDKRSAPETAPASEITKAPLPVLDLRYGPEWEPATFSVPGFDECFTRKEMHKLGLGRKTKCVSAVPGSPDTFSETQWDKRTAPETAPAAQTTQAPVSAREMRFGPDWEPATFKIPGYDECFTRKELHKLGLGHKTMCVSKMPESSATDLSTLSVSISAGPAGQLEPRSQEKIVPVTVTATLPPQPGTTSASTMNINVPDPTTVTKISKETQTVPVTKTNVVYDTRTVVEYVPVTQTVAYTTTVSGAPAVTSTFLTTETPVTRTMVYNTTQLRTYTTEKVAPVTTEVTLGTETKAAPVTNAVTTSNVTIKPTAHIGQKLDIALPSFAESASTPKCNKAAAAAATVASPAMALAAAAFGLVGLL